MAEEKKWTDAQEELRVYIVNTRWCYDIYHGMAKEIAKNFLAKGWSKDKKVITGYKYLKRAAEMARNAVRVYRQEIGSLGRIGCRQAGDVGMMILREDAQETFEFMAEHGES